MLPRTNHTIISAWQITSRVLTNESTLLIIQKDNLNLKVLDYQIIKAHKIIYQYIVT